MPLIDPRQNFFTPGDDEFHGRRWLVGKVADWAATPARILTISGAPGSGKTAFLKHFCRAGPGRVEAEQAVGPHSQSVGAHFCDSRLDTSVDPVRFVEALASGLSAALPRYRETLLQSGFVTVSPPAVNINATVNVASAATGATVAGVIVNIMDASPRRAVDQLIRRPLEMIGPVTRKPVFLVDALDETVSYAAEYGIARLIAESMADIPVRFIVTTRPDERVVSLLERAGSAFVDLMTERVAGEDDVEGYIDARLNELGADESGSVARSIAAASAGNYLYAHYVIRQLKADLSSGRAIDDALPAQLPQGLDELYEGFVARELRPGGSAAADDRWVTSIRPVLSLLVAALGNGLSRRQLSDISGIGASGAGHLSFGVDDVLRLLGQFCAVDPETTEYRLYHQSFREYLTQGDEPLINAREAHFRIGRYFLDQWKGAAWLACTDPYPMRHLESHLLQAAHALPSRSSHEINRLLLALRTDLHYLEARMISVGISTVLTDLARTPDDRQLVGLPDDLLDLAVQAAQIRAILAGRAHQLAATDNRAAAFFAQEVHNEAVKRGFLQVSASAAARLDQLTTPHARLQWSRGGESTGNLIGVLSGHTGVIRAMKLSPDGTALISAAPDDTVRIWDLTDRSCRVMKAPKPIRKSFIAPDGKWVVTSSLNRNVYVWNLKSETIQAVSDIVGVIEAVTITPDSRYAAAFFDETGRSVSDDHDGPGLLLVCELHTLRTWQWRFTSRRVNMLAPFPDNSRILAQTSSGPLLSIDIRTGGIDRIERPFDDPFWSWDFDSAGDMAVFGTVAGEIWVLDVTSREWRLVGSHATTEHQNRGLWFSVTGVKFVEADESVLSVSRDGTARIWNRHDGSARTVLSLEHPILAFAATRDKGRLAVGTEHGGVTVCDLATGQAHALQGHRGWVTRIALDATDRILFTGSDDRDVRIWDIGSPVNDAPPGHGAEIDVVTLSPDSDIAVSVDADGEMRSWHLPDASSKIVSRFRSRVHACVLISGGLAVAVLTLDGVLQLVHLDSGEVKALDKRRGVLVRDGRLLQGSPRSGTASSAPATLPVMGRVESLQEKLFVVRNNGMVPTEISCIAAGRSGTLLVAGTAYGSIWVWDLDSGRLNMFGGHSDKINQVLVARDGNTILSASSDGTMQLLRLSSQQQRTVPCTMPGRRAVGLGISHDGRIAVGAWSSGELALWDMDHDNVEVQQTFSPLLGMAVDPNSLEAAFLGFDFAAIVDPRSRRARLLEQLDEGEEISMFTSYGSEVFSPYAVDFAADGRRVVSCLNRLSIWDSGDNSVRCDLALPLNRRLVISTQKKDLLMVGDGNGAVALYRVC